MNDPDRPRDGQKPFPNDPSVSPDFPPGFAPYSSPGTPSTPFTGHGSHAFLLSSPSQSVESGSTFASPREGGYTPGSAMWAPTSHGIETDGDTRRDGPEDSDLMKKANMNVSSASLPPKQPRAPGNWLYRLWMGRWSMVILLFMGVGLAIGHHFFFTSLDGKPATNQMRYTRLGSIFSIAAKSCFVVATILAYHQRAWMVIKERAHSVRAVDTLFGAAENFIHLMSLTMFRNDLACLILALFVWTSPLIIVFSADTLSIDMLTRSENTQCPSIRTLNFELEGNNDWNFPQYPVNQSRSLMGLSSWNATRVVRNYSDPNFFDYWTSSSAQFQTVASSSLWGQKALVYEKAATEICGSGWNCSSTVSFVAPGYKCEELARGRGDEIKPLNGQLPPFTMDDLVPKGKNTYLAHATEGAYPPQILGDVSPGGMPPANYTIPKNFATFRTDPIIWLGYSSAKDLISKPPNSTNSTYSTYYTPIVFGCTHYRTRYKVKFNWYAGNTLDYEVLEREHLNKTINTTFIRSNKTKDQTLDVTHATPESNYVFPKDRYEYRVTAAYYSMGARLREIINGTMQGSISNTQAITTRLIDPTQWLPVPDVQAKLRDLYEDLIVSLINNPQFIEVAWASNSSASTGVATGSSVTDTVCQREITTNCFVYHKNALWAVYAVSIAVTFIGVILGFVASGRDNRDGELREMSFSEMVMATRGDSLQEVRWHQNMEKKKVKLLYERAPDDEDHGFVLEEKARSGPEKRGTGLGELARKSWRGKSEFEYRGNDA